MSKKINSLGRGLEVLLPKGPSSLSRVSLASIRPNPWQPRKAFPTGALEELSGSIREKGLLQPLIVRPRGKGYELVAGERRYRAAQLAGLAEVPVVIRDLDNREMLELALVENLQRADLNPVEEARGFAQLTKMDMTQEAVAQAIGKSRSTVANTMRLLQLPEEVLDALASGKISAGHARALLMLPGERRVWGLGQVLSRGLNVRRAEALAQMPAKVLPEKRTYPELASQLSAYLGVRVRCLGEHQGRLELYYGSEEELRGLLDKMGYQS